MICRSRCYFREDLQAIHPKFIGNSSEIHRCLFQCAGEVKVTRRNTMLLELAKTSRSTLNRQLSSNLREQAGRSVTRLQKQDEASEILIGILPDLGKQEGESLSLASEATRHERITTLRATEEHTKGAAVDVAKRLRPTKTETNIPGITTVEHDLSRLHNEQVDSSWLTNMVKLTATPSMINKLRQSKQVSFVVPNFNTQLPRPVRPTEEDLKTVHPQEEEVEREHTWGIDYLKIPQLWDQGLTGENIVIGHLDSGIEGFHPDLEGKIEGFVLADPRGQMMASEPFDSDEHGTHTAGTLVGGNTSGTSIGVAPKAKLVSALVLMRGSGTVYQVIKGTEWAISQGAKILNLSLGGAGYNATYEWLVSQVVQAEIFPVCSVGNDGVAVTGSPGNASLACGVGAIDHDGQVAEFSGGSSVSWFGPSGQLIQVHKPDLVAPGMAIRSSLPQGRWDYLNGTSMAAPHVAGIVALLMQAKPLASLSELVQAIYSSVKHPNINVPSPRDSRYGLGIIDPLGALARLTP
jgi:subtilisin family serine protease